MVTTRKSPKASSLASCWIFRVLFFTWLCTATALRKRAPKLAARTDSGCASASPARRQSPMLDGNAASNPTARPPVTKRSGPNPPPSFDTSYVLRNRHAPFQSSWGFYKWREPGKAACTSRDGGGSGGKGLAHFKTSLEKDSPLSRSGRASLGSGLGFARQCTCLLGNTCTQPGSPCPSRPALLQRWPRAPGRDPAGVSRLFLRVPPPIRTAGIFAILSRCFDISQPLHRRLLLGAQTASQISLDAQRDSKTPSATASHRSASTRANGRVLLAGARRDALWCRANAVAVTCTRGWATCVAGSDAA